MGHFILDKYMASVLYNFQADSWYSGTIQVLGMASEDRRKVCFAAFIVIWLTEVLESLTIPYCH